MSYFEYYSKQIYYEEHGKGTPLILLHGNTSCGKMFDQIVPKLEDKYRVIVIDFLGGGRSDRVEKWPADLWFDWACQVKALCDHLVLQKVKINGRAQAKTFGGFVDYLKSLHGEDWEQVFDADTDSVLRHAEQIGDFFHKPIDELKVPMLLTGSLEDDMFPKGHCKALFDEICAKTSFATAHIFERGGHPAMLSNMDEFVELLSVNG